MLQPALFISENEFVLLSAIVSVAFSRNGDKALLVLELSNHKSLTFTNREAEEMYAKIQRKVNTD